MRATPFTARLLAATAIYALASSQASAQDYGLQSTDSTPVNNPAGSTLQGARAGVLSTGPALNFDNAGTVRGDGAGTAFTQIDAGVVVTGGPANITNSGTISGYRFGVGTDLYFNPDTSLFEVRALGSAISNSGLISGDTDDAVRLVGGGTVTNSGQILAPQGAGVLMFAFGGQDLTQVTDLGTVNNLSGGLIQGNLGIFLGDGGTVVNAGTITGSLRGVEIARWWDPGRSGTVINSGTINGDIDFDSLDSASVTNSGTIDNPTGDAILSNSALSVDNDATGGITGSASGIRSSGPSLTVDNAGMIRGDGLNGSVFNSDGGIIISGGPAAISNSGDISGGRFGISTIYFTNPDNSTEDRAIGSTVNNSGSIIGDTDDGIRLIGGGTVTNSGSIAGRVGVGADGISMFAYNGQNTTGMTSIGSVTNLAGGVIEGNRWGIVLFGGGTIDNAGTINRAVNISGSPLLGAGQTGYVNNSGAINDGGIVMGVLDSGTVDNSGLTGTIGFAGVGNATVNNSGTVNYFTSFDTVTNAAVNNSGSIGEGLIFNRTTTANVTNSGSIAATNTPDVVGTTRDAVYSSAALTLTNTATGSINGFVSGIRSDGTSLSLDNAGTIRGNGTAVTGRIADAGILITGGPAAITNTGSISGAGFGITTGLYSDPNTNAPSGRAIGTTVNNSGSIIGDGNDGIRLMGGGSVTNSGYIAGRVGAGADGVSMFSFFDQDLNSFTTIGSLNNLAGGIIEGNRFGVIFSNGGIVDNAGTISGNSGSVLLQAGAVGTEPPRNGAVNNSGTLNGTVQFNNLANASVTNTGAITSLTGNGVFTTAPSGSLSVNNQATGSISGAASGIQSDGSSLSVTNGGTIRGNGTSVTLRVADAGILITGGPGTIVNSGSISGAGFGITTGVYSDPNNNNAASGRAVGTSVTNTGSIIGDSNDGVRLIGGGTVTNSGYIAGRVGAGADGVSMFAQSDQDTTALPQIGTVNNLAGGIIEGFRFGIIQSGGGTINNAGTINGGTNGAILIQTGFIGGKTGNITNSGTINGATTFFELANASVVNTGTMASTSTAGVTSSLTNGPMSINNGSTGSITGATSGIVSAGSSLSVSNAGTIRGNGSYDGFAALPDGGVEVAGGPANIQNSGTISGQRFGITTSYVLNPNTNLLEGRAIGSTVSNSGTIIGDTDTGVRLIGGGTVTNSGYIAGRVGSTADGVWMMAFNTQPLGSFTSIGSVTNLAGGVIEGNRRGVTLANGGSVNNAGTISGNAAAIRIVAVAGDTGRTGSVTNSSTGILNGSVQLMGLSNANLNNSGAISGGVGTGTSSDGAAVYSDSTLGITNATTASITGSSWGIYAEGPSLTLNNAGTIQGNALTGVYAATTSTTANITNSGTISGPAQGMITNGAATSITNSGTVQGLNGEGIRMNGGSISNSGLIKGAAGIESSTGTITNLTGGVIQGTGVFGIFLNAGGTVNNSGSILGANEGILALGGASTITNSGSISSGFFGIYSSGTITNSGSITTASGPAISAGGQLTLVNSGTINGSGAIAVQLNNTNDTVTLLTGSSINGAVDGANGSDTLRLSGTIATPTASQTVGRFLNFETFNVLGGYWTAPGNTGAFTSTTLTGGALAVNGTLTSPVTVNAASMLAGTGTITGNVTTNSGGIISPGTNAIGTLNVTGNILFNAGSTFSVQTNPNGTSDRLAVTGAVTINKGATLQILAGIFPNYPTTSSYVVLTASGGINGKFDSVVTDYAYFKATVNTQQKGTITVQIAPNGKPLPSAATATTFSTASAVESLGTSSAIYQKVLYQSLTGARQAFSSLSGSSYARLDGLMANDIGRVELGLDSGNSTAPTLQWNGTSSLSALGPQSGKAVRSGSVSLMMVGGRYVSRLATDSLTADIDTRFLASAAGYRSGRFQALASVTSAWHDVSVGRTIAFPGFADRTSARYAAESQRIDLEGSYSLTSGKIAIAPYGGLSRVMMKSHGFQEVGGISSLNVGRDARTIGQARLGIRARAEFRLGSVAFAPHADVSFNRSWGDLEVARQAQFAGGSEQFDSIGAGFDSRMTAVDAGIDAKLGRITLTGSYRGRLGNRWRDHSALLRAALSF